MPTLWNRILPGHRKKSLTKKQLTMKPPPQTSDATRELSVSGKYTNFGDEKRTEKHNPCKLIRSKENTTNPFEDKPFSGENRPSMTQVSKNSSIFKPQLQNRMLFIDDDQQFLHPGQNWPVDSYYLTRFPNNGMDNYVPKAVQDLPTSAFLEGKKLGVKNFIPSNKIELSVGQFLLVQKEKNVVADFLPCHYSMPAPLANAELFTRPVKPVNETDIYSKLQEQVNKRSGLDYLPENFIWLPPPPPTHPASDKILKSSSKSDVLY